MQLTVLGSGSRGNAILVEDGETRVLLDAGFGVRTLAARLAAVGVPPESVQGLVLTHEHDDHAKGAAAACARWGWPVYGTRPTLRAIGEVLSPARGFEAGVPFAVGSLRFEPHAVPHDAATCTAFAITARRSGARAACVLDLGHAPDGLADALGRVELLLVEANHDDVLLATGPYPPMLKRRIGGDRGHLSNAQAAALVGACAHRGLRGVILAHLSERNNTPQHAHDAVAPVLRRRGAAAVAREGLVTAAQRTVLGPVGAGVAAARHAGQFELL